MLLRVRRRRAQQSPAFTSKIEAVRVDVLVTDNGQPVRGLGPADFEIVDNGVPQQVELVSFDEIPLNVILALDMSDSVAGERLEQLRGAGGGLLAAFCGSCADTPYSTWRRRRWRRGSWWRTR